MFEKVPGTPGLVEGEHEVLALWRETQAFAKLQEQARGKPRWSFLDGPITANNPMGVHHAWGRTYKDLFQRYFAMTGHDQRWQNGFDCQGLWVEVEVEKELGFTSKRDIEEFGLEEFINRCKERVLKYSALQTEQSIRLGMWMDWDDSYFTMSEENNYMIWAFLKKCHQRGLIYKGLDSMPWCPRCGTGISEQERKEGYREVTDLAVYVRLALRDRPNEYLLIWTTTPWTLAANVAAAVNPDLEYVRIQQGDDFYYVSSGRRDVLKSESRSRGEPKVDGTIKGSQMVGWEYDGPFDELPAAGEAVAAHRVIAWEEVADATGTGIVHIAPGCGKEDFDLGRELGLPIVAPIDEAGIYYEGFGFLTARSALEVAADVVTDLRSKGLYYKAERYVHDYPHCWRCGTALLFRAVDEWYIDMSWREEIKKVADQIEWIPSYGHSQEIDWLNNMGDWMISKKRYWGLALPIFHCDTCDWFDVIGGRDELKERSIEGWDRFVGDPDHPNTPHRPWVDSVVIRCEKCGSNATRIPDVGNPWLDAGIVPYSTVKYSTDRDYWKQWIPADFVVESFPGQFRNWFYALLAMSTMMENLPPFKTLLGYALVRDEHGEEMHKSKGNSIEFNEAADTMSADVMRWLYCRQNPTLNMNFGYNLGKQVERKVFGTLWNSYLFFTNYALLDEFDPSSQPVPIPERPEIDRWILSDLNMLIRSARQGMESFNISGFMREAESFIDQLSNWYIRRNRQRFWNPKGTNESDKAAAYHTLYEVILTLSKLLAPVVPFVTERIYQNLVRNVDPGAPVSVHLCAYPEPDSDAIDESLSFQMQVAQQIAGAGRALREEAGHRVRQPLAELRVAARADAAEAVAKLTPLILDELNVKELNVVEDLGELTAVSAKPNFASLGPRFGQGAKAAAEAIRQAPSDVVRRWQAGEAVELEVAGGTLEINPSDVAVHVETREGWVVAEAGDIQVALDASTTPELVNEGYARDVVRQIQQLRKDLDLNIEDRIEVAFATTSAELSTIVGEWSSYIRSETQADTMVEGTLGLEPKQVEVAGAPVSLELRKV